MRFNRIFLLILACTLLFGGCETRNTNTVPQGDVPAVNDTVTNKEQGSPEVEKDDFMARVIFVGDSTTAHMASRAAVSRSQVWATKTRYLNLSPRVTDERIVLPETGTELTVAAAAGATRPAFLVITLGIDYGVYYYRDAPDKFAFYYEKLLDAISAASPETTLILQSVFPVGRQSKAITNGMVDNANRVIKEIADRRGLCYLDANTLLKDGDGYLAERFCDSADGIHLTAAAYAVILQNLTAHENEIVGAKK